MQRRATVIFITFVASLLTIGPAAAQGIVGLDPTMKAIDAQRRVDAEFTAGLTRVEQAAREEAHCQWHDEAMIDSEGSTVADLQRLWSEIDSQKIRLDAIDACIRYANDQILHLTGSIAGLGQLNRRRSKRLYIASSGSDSKTCARWWRIPSSV